MSPEPGRSWAGFPLPCEQSRGRGDLQTPPIRSVWKPETVSLVGQARTDGRPSLTSTELRLAGQILRLWSPGAPGQVSPSPASNQGGGGTSRLPPSGWCGSPRRSPVPGSERRRVGPLTTEVPLAGFLPSPPSGGEGTRNRRATPASGYPRERGRVGPGQTACPGPRGALEVWSGARAGLGLPPSFPPLKFPPEGLSNFSQPECMRAVRTVPRGGKRRAWMPGRGASPGLGSCRLPQGA